MDAQSSKEALRPIAVKNYASNSPIPVFSRGASLRSELRNHPRRPRLQSLALFLAVLTLQLFLAAALVPGAAFASEAQKAPLKVALLLEDGSDLNPAARLMKEGLARAARQCRMEAHVVLAGQGTDKVALFCKAAKECDLVLVAEPGLHAVLRSNAGNFRTTSFGCLDTSILGLRAANIMSITFDDAQPAFLAGAAAALLVKDTQRLGWVEAAETPAGNTMLAGFAAGALLSRSGVRIVRKTDSSREPKALLDELAAQNVAVTVLAQGARTEGFLSALQKTSLFGIGMDADMAPLALGHVPFSIIKRFDRAVEELCLRKAQGTFMGRKTLVYSLKNQGTDLAINKDFAARAHVPASVWNHVLKRIGELKRELENGNISLEDKRVPTLCNCLD